jgi:2-polyprenyl-3-methyl-5-hydroxy-6-metoxy-1,4-benzoquinol methylase
LVLSNLISRLAKRLLKQVSLHPYYGQSVNFQSTLEYFDGESGLHTYNIKKTGIEDAAVELIASTWLENFDNTTKCNLLDIGTGEGALLKKIAAKVSLSNIQAVEPLEKYHGSVELDSPDVEICWVTGIKSVKSHSIDFCTMIGVAAYMDDSTFVATLRDIEKILRPGGLLFVRSVLKHTHPELKVVSYRNFRLLSAYHRFKSIKYKTIRRTLCSELNIISNHFNVFRLKRVHHLGQDCFLHVWIKL